MKLKRCSLNALICSAVTLTAGLPAAAQSDADIAAAGRACFSIERDARRLACFERAFDSAAASESAPPQPAAVAHAVPAAVAPAVPAAADVRQAPASGGAAAVAAGAGRAPTPAARAALPDQDQEQEQEQEQVRIVGTREIRPGDVRLLTAEGVIYCLDGSRLRPLQFPAIPFTATLERGALGSRFLRFGPDSSQRIRVTERN